MRLFSRSKPEPEAVAAFRKMAAYLVEAERQAARVRVIARVIAENGSPEAATEAIERSEAIDEKTAGLRAETAALCERLRAAGHDVEMPPPVDERDVAEELADERRMAEARAEVEGLLDR